MQQRKHIAFVNMRLLHGNNGEDGGLVLAHSITKATSEEIKISPTTTVDGHHQSHGIVAYKFDKIPGRESEPVCTFSFMHQWFDDDGSGNAVASRNPVPSYVSEIIFR